MGTGYDNYTTKRRIIQSASGNNLKVDNLGMIATDTNYHQRESFDEGYHVNKKFTVPPSSSVTITIATPTTGEYPHGSISITGSQTYSYTLSLSTITYGAYSTATTGMGKGSYLYPHNINRGLNYTRCTTEFFYGDTYSSKAGDIYKDIEEGIGGSAFTMCESIEGQNWLLDVGRVYNVVITNTSAATASIVLRYVFHEHEAVESTVTDSPDGESATEYAGHLGHI